MLALEDVSETVSSGTISKERRPPGESGDFPLCAARSVTRAAPSDANQIAWNRGTVYFSVWWGWRAIVPAKAWQRGPISSFNR